jgi:hypothetical protein
MNSSSNINPKDVAEKLSDARNQESPRFTTALQKEPRLSELAWFLQWQSLQPGRLPQFTLHFLDVFHSRLGTPAMRRIGRIAEPYSIDQRRAVIKSIPNEPDGLDDTFDAATRQLLDQLRCEVGVGFDSLSAIRFLETGRDARPDRSNDASLNAAFFFSAVRRVASSALPAIFFRFCAERDYCIPDVWFFDGLQSALLEMMEVRASRILDTLPDTEMGRTTLDAIEFAFGQKSGTKCFWNADFRARSTLIKRRDLIESRRGFKSLRT